MVKPALRYTAIALCTMLLVACAKKGQDVISEMSNDEVCEELMGGINRPVYRRALLSEIEHRGISCRTREGEESTRTPNEMLFYQRRY